MLLRLRQSVLLFALTTGGINVSAQLIDNTSTFKNINAKSYFRFHYDNDVFTKTDYYYTQGITLEYVHPSIEKFFLTKLLYKPKNSSAKYGIAFNLFGYTPTSIKSNAILYGDRPFEANLSLKLFSIATNNSRQERIASALSVGVIGPAALGEEIQTNIHRWTGNKLPKGWNNQIRNDIILNYQLNYEKKLVAANAFLLNGAAELNAGTLNDRLSGGLNFMTGHFNNRYQQNPKKKTEYYLYGQAKTTVIGYDATMQGGLFNRKSPYIIPSEDISRITFQADAGVVVNFRKLSFSYSQSFLTKEFATGKQHRWGGLTFGFSF